MVSNIMGYICAAMFALVAVMLFNFMLARLYSKTAKTGEQELLDSTMNYYSNTTPVISLDREVCVQRDTKYMF